MSYEITAVATVRDIRRANLLLLEQELGTLQKVADLVGKSHSQLSQIKSANKHSTTGEPRGMGDRVAADFTKALRVPNGWMDAQRSADEVSAAVRALDSALSASVHRAAPPATGSAAQTAALRLALEFASLPEQLPGGASKAQLFDQLMQLMQSQHAQPAPDASSLGQSDESNPSPVPAPRKPRGKARAG